MRRFLLIAVAAALAVGALAAPAPPQPPGPEPLPIFATAERTVAGVWYCPWVQASFEVDSDIALVTTAAADATVTFPNPEPGGEIDTVELELDGPGGTRIAVGDVALRGNAPGFVEFTQTGSAVAAYIHSAERLSGDTCLASVPSVWYLPGGESLQGSTLTLRMFNPFPEPAKVSVAAVSEFGPEPLPGLDGVQVSPRNWLDAPLEEDLRLRETLAVSIETEEGTVLPAFVLANDEDDAVWPGTGLAREWQFPSVRVAAGEPKVAILNPNAEPANVDVDVFGPDGAVQGARSASVLAGAPQDIPLGDLAEGAFGIRVRADLPVAAAVVSAGGGSLAATAGLSQRSSRWLLAGAGSGGAGTVRSLWVMNTAAEELTVTLLPVGDDDMPVDKIAVPPESIRQYIIEQDDVAGFIAEALQPFTAAWSTQSPEGSALAAGTPLP